MVKCAHKKLGSTDVKYVEELRKHDVRAKLDKICKNTNNPLHKCFRLLPHGVRMRVPSSRTNRLWDDFVNSANNIYNSN